jgi:CheY-like chemotaxis protein
LTERQVAGLATIQESGQHLLTLINDILDLARVEAGKMMLYPAPTDLGSFLQVVVDIIRVKAEEKSLLVYLRTAPGCRPGDHRREAPAPGAAQPAGQCRQVHRLPARFAARKPAPPDCAGRRGQAALRGGRQRDRHERGTAGQRCSSPSNRWPTWTRREGGTGLGLAISQQLVHLMGGAIAVTSEAGKGSTFWFELVLPVATSVPANLPLLRTIIGYEGPRRKLLIVDDVRQNRAMLIDLLQALDFVVDSANDGLECLAMLDSFKPELIVMDVMMPEVDGNETTRRIRRLPQWRTMPIIALSASASREDEQASLEAGADIFLAKPVDHDVLLNAIGAQLSLDWKTRQSPPAPRAADEDEGAVLVVPPAPEIETLWQLARMGNMRMIIEQASSLAALDPAYAQFTQRLQTLAQGYHSKAVLAFVERYRTENV